MNAKRYAKAIVAAVGVTAMAITGALADDLIDTNEVTQILILAFEGALTVWGVYQARNRTRGE